MRIAIVHDYLNQRGGAERVVAAFHEMFPEAPIFTSVLDRSALWPELRSADIRVSWMQRLPGLRRHFKKYLLLYPLVFERLDLSGYDLVLSSSSAYAKGTKAPRGGAHVCYCHTPARFIWNYEQYVAHEDLGLAVRTLLPFGIRFLRGWDLRTANRPTAYVANSRVVADRIGRFYKRNATVVPPPVDVARFRGVMAEPGDYYLVVSRLNAYKRIDLAVEAFNRLRLPLVIAGDGPRGPALRRMAGPTIRFLGHVDERELLTLMAGCRALIFPGEEDFGITVVEANAAGRPVVAYLGGGALDTVDPGVTGVFFSEPSPESLADAVLRSAQIPWDSSAIRQHASRFDGVAFRQRMDAVLAPFMPRPAAGRAADRASATR